VAAAAATLAVAGCSSGPPDYQPAPGTLVAGTAQMTVNGQNIGTT
jgi:ipoprotein LpqH